MDAFQIRFASELRDKLSAEIVDLQSKLVSTMQSDYAGYAQQVGYIRGLKRALEQAEAIETLLSRPEQKPQGSGQHKLNSYES